MPHEDFRAMTQVWQGALRAGVKWVLSAPVEGPAILSQFARAD